MKYLTFFFVFAFGISLSADLKFEERIDAQKKIEKIFYEKRLWPKENPDPKPPFEKAISEESIKRKVEDYLKKSSALEEFWNHPITGEELQAEIERMVKQTKDPQTLKAIFSALNNDPYIIAECLARPNLVEKLINSYYAYDKRFHKEKMEEINEIYKTIKKRSIDLENNSFYRKVRIKKGNCEEKGLTGIECLSSEEFDMISSKFPPSGISEIKETPEAFVIYITKNRSSNELEGGIIYIQKQTIDKFLNEYKSNLNISTPLFEYKLPQINILSSTPTAPDAWEPLWYIPEGRESHNAVWTGSEMIVWGGQNEFTVFITGGRYIPSSDTWFPISTKDAPSLRTEATAVWTGQEMIIWGGSWNYSGLNTGARYDPSIDKWTPISTNNAPAARTGHTAVWTGMEMIVWGGFNGSSKYNTGGRYNPSTDTWVTTSTMNAPSERFYHTAVWSGTEMLIWGGSNGTNNLNSGGMYNPSSNSWVSIDTTDADTPSGRILHTALWIGSGMAIWGGEDGGYLNTGAIYRPSIPGNYWIPITTNDAPEGRSKHTAVWTGEKMIIWGGERGYLLDLNTGGLYNPLTDSWQETNLSDAPTARFNHSAVWSGSEMIVWGGNSLGSVVNNGGRYNPSSNSWIPVENSTVPSARMYHTSVWTGAEMIVWGGFDGMNYLNTGSKFIPATGNWTATSTEGNVPSGRQNHTAIWNGSQMIVWGGYDGTNYLNTGGRYYPSTDTWVSINTTNAPSARSNHTAVWTGSKMIVWGGHNSTENFNTGGVLENDNWSSVSTTDPDTPSPRTGHTAVWTGTEMIIWGGADNINYYKDGAKYDPTKPEDEAWVPLFEVPETFKGRKYHTAVWTGSEMVIWGGETSSNYLNDGAYYNYQGNYWLDLPSTTLSARSQHSAVWTGSGMIVWGGMNSTGALNTGAHWIRKIKDWGESDWLAPFLILEEDAPTPRYSHPAVWTGQEMIVWDGKPMSQSGGMYYPNTPPTAVPLLANSESAYDTAFHAPTCSQFDSFCDSNNSAEWLLVGRDGVVSEPNTPNTLDYETCLDGTDDHPDYNKFIDRIKIYTENGAKFFAGLKVIVEVTVVASAHYFNEYLDVYYTPNASSNPIWNHITTLKPVKPGEQVLSTSFNLASGGSPFQAIRANFRLGGGMGGAEPCSAGTYDDHDDLVFRISPDFSAQTFTLGSSQLLYLDGSSSRSGSNPDTAIPNEDQYDGFTSPENYEWDLNQDAGFDNEYICNGTTSWGGVDRIGSKPAPLTEEDLAAFGITRPSAYPIWLRVTDKAGLKSCSSVMLVVKDGILPTVKLLSPNGGETWKYSPSETSPIDNLIVWEAQDNDELSSYTVRYSTYGGLNPTTIYSSKNEIEKNYMPEGLPIADCEGQAGNCTPGVTNSIINISFDEQILDVNVKINLLHSYDSDLEIILIGPNSTQVTLSYRNGGEGQDYIDTIFDDQAEVPIYVGTPPFTGTFAPQQGMSLSVFNYTSSKGDWTLRILDHATGGSGVIHSWSISFNFAYNSSYLWTMPTKEGAANANPPQIFPSATCRIEVEVCDMAGKCSTDMSDDNFYIVQPTTSSIKTMILWNKERINGKYGMGDQLEEKLQELANHLKVTGTIKDLSLVRDIKNAYTCWDDCYDGNGCGDDPPCETASSNPQERANKVAEEIWNYLYNPTDGQISKTYTNVQNIILIGDDEQIPFYRIKDGTTIYPESIYPTEVGIDTTNTVGSAISSGYFLTDNFYSELRPENSGLPAPHDKIYQNDFAIGRLVENPYEIENLINTFIGQDGQLNVTTSQNKVLIAGFTFVYDSATKIKRNYINASKSIDCLMDDPVSRADVTNCSPPITDPETNFEYTPQDLYDQLFIPTPHSISSIMTHANHYSFATPLGYMGPNKKSLCTDSQYDSTCATLSLAYTPYNLYGTVLYTSGCHSGLPIPNSSENYVLDLPQVMAQQKVLGYIGNTGYAWAILDGIGLTEKLMELLTNELLDNSSITIGEALSRAKRKYFLEEKRYDVFDEKVMHELTLYGIPNYLIVTSNARSSEDEKLPPPLGPDSGCANGICLEKKINTKNTFGEVPENVTELLLNFTFGEGTHQLVTVKNTDGTLKGHYFTLNGVASGETGDSIQPKFIYDSYLSGTKPHGVVFTGGSYSLKGPLSGDFIPISAVPKSTNDPSSGAGPLPGGSVFVPGLKASTGAGVSSGLRGTEEKEYLNMVVHTGYYEEGSTKDNIYDKMQFAVYYHKDSSDFTLPTITAPDQMSFNSTDTPILIPDNDPNGAISTINVSGSGITSIKDINVKININHTSDNNLTIYLIGPDLTQVMLCNLKGGTEDNFTDTLFDDDATLSISSGIAPFTGTFRPESPLSAFQGKGADGNWKLKVVDSVSGDTGSIVSWQITFNEKFHTLSGMVASFGVKAEDSSDIYRVLITYDDKYKKQWKSIDLVKNEFTGVWEGELALKGSIRYYIQAVDKAGNVGQVKEYGQDQNSNGQKYGSTWEYAKLFNINLLDSDSDTMPDAYEETHSCLNKNLNDANQDHDYDYLTNLKEFEYDTNPCRGDSDGGGDNDGSEKNNGRNPLALPDDKHLTIMITKNGNNYTIDWNDSYGQNSLIDGYYFVYRSDTPFFDPADKINLSPIPDGTKSYIDTNPPCTVCYYNVWNYQLDTQPPKVEAVIPSTGSTAGGTSVKIYGENFQVGAKVYFDNILTADIVFVNESQINCKTPPHSAGAVDVKVVNPNGQEGILTGGFTYQ